MSTQKAWVAWYENYGVTEMLGIFSSYAHYAKWYRELSGSPQWSGKREYVYVREFMMNQPIK